MARARLPGDLAGQRRTARAARRRTRTATTTWASWRTSVVERYPTHVHLLSPVLTLQGAVAHSDMPVESGPTMYLPYSHQYLPGYLAWRLPEFRAYFARALRPAPAGQGRRRLLQPRAVPRRRHQRLRRHPARRQPAPGLVGVRSRDGDGRPRPRDPGRLPGAAATEAAGAADAARRTTRWPLQRRATRSRPTSTSTSPSTDSPRRRRPRSSASCWPRRVGRRARRPARRLHAAAGHRPVRSGAGDRRYSRSRTRTIPASVAMYADPSGPRVIAA